MCEHVCACVSICACVSMCEHVNMCERMWTCVHVWACEQMWAGVNVCACVSMCEHVCMYEHMSMCACVNMYKHTWACVNMCACVRCEHVWMCKHVWACVSMLTFKPTMGSEIKLRLSGLCYQHLNPLSHLVGPGAQIRFIYQNTQCGSQQLEIKCPSTQNWGISCAALILGGCLKGKHKHWQLSQKSKLGTSVYSEFPFSLLKVLAYTSFLMAWN